MSERFRGELQKFWRDGDIGCSFGDHLLHHKNAKAIVLISFGIGCQIMAKNIPIIRQIRDRLISRWAGE